LAALAACAGCAPEPSHPDGALPACSVEASLTRVQPASLRVEATCQGFAVERLRAPAETGSFFSEVQLTESVPLTADGNVWRLPGRSSALRYRYTVGLEAIAGAYDHFDVAERSGDSLIAPAASWLLRPEPAPPGTPVRLSVRTPPHARFVTGLTRREGAHFLRSEQLRVATYGVFGSFATYRTAMESVSDDPAEIRTVLLDGSIAAGGQRVVAWVERGARAVAGFYGGFPVPRAMLAIVPQRGRRGVLFGKVLPQSEPAIAVSVGAETRESDLYGDWVLVHELFHLGFPSFFREGRWLDEGLATYYEPLIRARAGLATEAEVWSELLREMTSRIAAGGDESLEAARDFRRVYWGGAALCLIADVWHRKRSDGARGLEDGLRALVRGGGTADRVWSLDRAIDFIDGALDATILRQLAERHAHRAEPIALADTWDALGVRIDDGRLELDPSPERTRLRRSVLFGTENMRSGHRFEQARISSK
jgi:hypothetical protein